MSRNRIYRLPIALLCPPLVLAKTFNEHRQVIASEALILEYECPLCQHQDTCLVLDTRLAYYPHLVDPLWEYPKSPDIWVLQSRLTDAHCVEYTPDLIKIETYKKPVCPPLEDDD